MNTSVVGRFAPSPSGRMHLGNLFVALLAWLSVKAQGGRMVLRIENLDPNRSKPAHIESIMDDLLWLGLNWDDGPLAAGCHSQNYYQSNRIAYYEQQLQKLDVLGLLYPCFCSRAELHTAQAPHASDGHFIYSGHCRSLTKKELASRQSAHPPSLRLKVPNETISFTDGCQGLFSQNLARDCGDFIVRRSDGVFAYQLATPVDDYAMGVTEVVRGRDLLSSTPRQLLLLQQLGYAPPRYYHPPLLLSSEGRRLSKRDQDLHLGAIRARCSSPQPLLGALAHLAGLLPTPKPVPADALIGLFQWNKVPQHDIVVDSSFYHLLGI